MVHCTNINTRKKWIWEILKLQIGFEKLFISIVLVTLVFGMFVLFAVSKIKYSREEISRNDKSVNYRRLKKLDLVFSGIFLLFVIVVLIIFILNVGK